MVNWFSIEVRDHAGRRTHYNSFITDLPVTAESVAELAVYGRAQWKIEQGTFNVLKTNGYKIEHNSGHGREVQASLLVSLDRRAFACHTAADPGVLAWRESGASGIPAKVASHRRQPGRSAFMASSRIGSTR